MSYGTNGLRGCLDVTEQARAIRALQIVGDPFLYAILTKPGLIKIGITGNLVKRKCNIEGGTRQILAFRPGTFEDEQSIHASLRQYRAYRTEYYRPASQVLEQVNWLRSYYGLDPIDSIEE